MFEHHSYICRVPAVTKQALTEVRNVFVGESTVETQYIYIEAFGIDDVRALIQTSFVKPTAGEVLLLVVGLKSITVESQQALLKILEEPPSTTVFLFVVPDTLTLLPTTLSRFQVFQGSTTLGVSGVHTDYEEFKKLSPAQRTVLIADKMTIKDTLWVEAIKIGLQHDLKQSGTVTTRQNLSTLYYVAENLQTRGAGNKMLLEELAFSLV